MTSRLEKNKSQRKKIIKEEKKEKNAKIMQIVFKMLLCLTLIVSFAYIILRYVGNIGLVIKENSYIYDNLPEEFHGTKIVHFSDLHYGTTVNIKKLKDIVNKINKLEPDIIVFTGDLVDMHYPIDAKEIEKVKDELNRMDSKLGKYAVPGNHDKKSFDLIMKDTDFIVLENSYDLIYNEGYNPILITGIGSNNLKRMDMDKAFNYFTQENVNKEIFTISLLHEPDNIDEILNKYNVNLALAGHSHNGQVRLPFTSALVRFTGAKKYFEEEYTIDSTNLLISGGIGTSILPFRLFNHPSINFIRLRQY